MAALRSRCGHYIFVLWFHRSFFPSPNLSCRSFIGCLPYFRIWRGIVVQGMELRNFWRRRRHLYSAGRPSRSALAHILFHTEFCLLALQLLSLARTWSCGSALDCRGLDNITASVCLHPCQWINLIFFADRKIVTLLMDLKSQVQVLAHQQPQILAQLLKTGSTGGSKAAPKLPDGVVLPLNRTEQVTSLERRLTRSPEDKLNAGRMQL